MNTECWCRETYFKIIAGVGFANLFASLGVWVVVVELGVAGGPLSLVFAPFAFVSVTTVTAVAVERRVSFTI